MTTKPLTTAQFFRQFPDDETCLQHLFDVRFGEGFECPKCERASKWFRIKAERAYSCQWCGHHLHPTVGTPFEKTRTPLQLWFYAIHLFTTTRHGVSGKELQRQLGVTYKTAWRMAKLIREHMADVDGERPIGGPGTNVEIDETLVGGVKRGKHNRGSAAKTVVVGALERGGDLITAVVPNQRRATLEPFVTANVRIGGNVHTDELRSYASLSNIGYRHARVNHSAMEYAYYDYRLAETVSVNSIENFWRHLKCSINGTHTSVSPKYLGLYAKEFEYRFNRRNRPETMFSELVSTFRPLNAG
ncbi:IS1595 family transposase [Qipengyuania marisflavi]|uniref:IS1595 family transposase n=1 Tax=Qipengyuania marisflavi TaxID=2486356 RepID=A0A5S3NY81_9SPHN|nr:IS1595 family transposase [Qipengyuania marisflavi]TMM45342.1 IS1595 family transposase [Qipengyuania marisflavi]